MHALPLKSESELPARYPTCTISSAERPEPMGSLSPNASFPYTNRQEQTGGFMCQRS